MVPHEIVTIVLPLVASAILVPLVLKALARRYPPEGHADDDSPAHYRRHVFIEVIGAFSFFVGVAVPFWYRGTGTLQPTLADATLVLASAIVFSLGGMRVAASAFRDGPAHFLSYFSRKCGLGRAAVRFIARSLFALAAASIVLILASEAAA